MQLTTVFRTFSPAEAQLISSLLEAAEIPVHVADELSALSMEGYSMTTGGIRIQVPEEAAAEARALIETREADVS